MYQDLDMHESILRTLSDEHAHLFLLLREIENAVTPPQRTGLFEAMKEEIIPHMRGEELTIYEKLRSEIADEKALELAVTSDVDHHHIRDYLQKLNLLEIDSPEWMDVYKEFRSFTERHCLNEEKDLFPTAKEDFSEFELEEFAFDFEEAKFH
jgi:hypothetical protein